MPLKSHHNSEGFTLIEIVVVMAIITILIAGVVTMMESAKRAGRHQQATTLARSYFDAAVDFAVDNGGTAPIAGTADWPTAHFERGPVDSLQANRNQRYLTTVPESAGTSRLAVTGSSTPPAGPRVAVTYHALNAMTFEVVGWVDQTAVCRITNGTARTSLPPC